MSTSLPPFLSANPPPSPGDQFFKQASRTTDSFLVITVVFSVLSILGSVAIAYFVYRCVKKNGLPAININTSPAPAVAGSTTLYAVVPDSQIRDATVERFLKEIAGEKPIRFTPQQLSGFTNNYSARLGAGGFGAVYKGMLPNGLTVAVKRLHPGHDDRTSQEQFMAEVGTIGRTHHINLVRLFGFCYDAGVRALVYEYMEHGALDSYLFDRSRHVGFQTMRAIAVGVARGLRYLHEECQQKIVHYDIKPGNVLLDGALTPKVADFGLAQLLNRADTHKTVSGMRGTPGYAAPEMWMQAGATEKCDVYSFGILLFEILGRRRNFDEAAPESQRWFPKLAEFFSRYARGVFGPSAHRDVVACSTSFRRKKIRCIPVANLLLCNPDVICCHLYEPDIARPPHFCPRRYAARLQRYTRAAPRLFFMRCRTHKRSAARLLASTAAQFVHRTEHSIPTPRPCAHSRAAAAAAAANRLAAAGSRLHAATGNRIAAAGSCLRAAAGSRPHRSLELHPPTLPPWPKLASPRGSLLQSEEVEG